MAAELDRQDFTLGSFTFTLGTNTFREDRGRQVLSLLKSRYLGEAEFDSELERLAAVESMDPFYTDIIGATKAINGDPRHPELRGFMAFPRKWDDFYWDLVGTGEQPRLIEAALYTQGLHPHWYPKPQVPAEAVPEADETLRQTMTALDPDNTSDVEPPDTETIMEAVQERADAAADARGDDFLDRSRS